MLDVDTTPLNQRGWVVQERMIVRTLHCTKNQPYWECQDMSANESYPLGLQINLNNKSKECKQTLHRHDVVTAPRLLHGHDMSKVEWLRLISRYSRCKLTKENDILVAIPGLAKRWRYLFPDKYRAGLWEKSLPSGLLWYGMKEFSSKTFPRGPLRGPSWSWLLYKEEIRWSDAVCPLDGASKFISIEATLADMLQYDNELASDDPTGPVVSGVIVLQGAPLSGALIGSYQLKYGFIASHIGWRSIVASTGKRTWSGVCCFGHHDLLMAVKDLLYLYICVPFILSKLDLPGGLINLMIEGLIFEITPPARGR